MEVTPLILELLSSSHSISAGANKASEDSLKDEKDSRYARLGLMRALQVYSAWSCLLASFSKLKPNLKLSKAYLKTSYFIVHVAEL